MLIHAVVTSRLDANNALLYGVPNKQLCRLGRLQRTAARIIVRKKKYDHIGDTLKMLHWLPIPERIEYKILLLVYKSLNGYGPQYLTELFSLYKPQRALRSSKLYLLEIPKTRLKTVGDHALSVAGPKLWNELPESIKEAETVDSFKSLLKTMLFKRAYNC